MAFRFKQKPAWTIALVRKACISIKTFHLILGLLIYYGLRNKDRLQKLLNGYLQLFSLCKIKGNVIAAAYGQDCIIDLDFKFPQIMYGNLRANLY